MISEGIKLNIKLKLKSKNGYPDNWSKNSEGIPFFSSSFLYAEFNGANIWSILNVVLELFLSSAPKNRLIVLLIGLGQYFTTLYNIISIGISSFSFFI